MARRLKEADGRAVDMVLDRLVSDNPGAPVIPATQMVEPHIQAVERVLQLVSAMPADEPAPDLITRTLAKIAAAPPLASPAAYANRDHLSA